MRQALLLMLALVACDPEPLTPGSDAGSGRDAETMSCAAPREVCGSRCINRLSDPDHCGGCNHPCTGGSFCSNGECTSTCGAGLKACDGTCVDVATERLHCGDCDKPCANGLECRSGSCFCPGDLVECQLGAGCVDTDSDEANCGICGRTCRADQECVLGSCTCTDGFLDCDGACVDGQRTHDRCGRCDRVCAVDEVCREGDCACAGGDTESDCTNGDDDDCDTLADCLDDDCVGETRACAGACGPGIETCSQSHVWGACVGGSGEAEICGDGIDQDCNGSDLRNPDSYEPNDTCTSCRSLSATVDPAVSIRASFDSRNDRKDCYCFQADDSASPFPENINVSLTQIPLARDFDVFLYPSVAECTANNPIARSENNGNLDDTIDWGERFGSDDGGTWVVCVTNPFASFDCSSTYSLSVDGLR
ncbi:MAG: hypothetical protein HYV07_28785 [Deltaproteobacteria bacterium]|nr:hypothetical protein [Deltaproteobacteria bacterium]